MEGTRKFHWPVWPWCVLLVLGLVDATWLLASPVSVDTRSLATIAALCGLGAAFHTVATRWPVSPRAAAFASGLGFILVAWPILRLFNYAMMSAPHPFADAQLAAWDAALGFDWLAYLRWVDQWPLLVRAMGWAYHGLTAYSIIAFALIVLVYGPQRASTFVLTFLVVTVITCLTGPWFPALGPMAQHAAMLSDLRHLAIEDGTWGVEPLLQIRSGGAQALSIQHLPGLTSIPSLHTAMGVIVIHSCRGKPWVLLPVLLVNGLMIAATPVFGGHYVVDVIGGVAVAVVAIAIVAILEGTPSRARRMRQQRSHPRSQAAATRQAFG